MANFLTDTIQAGSRVLWSPDGMTLLTVTYNGVLSLWDAIDGDRLAILETLHEKYGGQGNHFTCVAWSPDGVFIAAGTYLGQIFVWEYETRKICQFFRAHYQEVTGVSWSHNGQLASASWDTMVKVWKVGENSPCLTYTGHDQRVTTLAWSPDGHFLASAGLDKTAQVWRAVDGKRIQVYRGHRQPIHALDWSPDGASLASTGDDHSLQIWRAAIGRQWWRRYAGVWGMQVASVKLPEAFRHRVQWSGDGRILAVRIGTGVRIFSAKTLACVETFLDGFVQEFSISPEGTYMALTSASRVSLRQLPSL